MSNKRSGRAPALFDDPLFAEDLKRTSDTGREVASAARREYQKSGVPLDDLLPLQGQEKTGTRETRPERAGCYVNLIGGGE